MNWLESVYCYTQYERLQQGESITYSSQNGNVLLTVSLLILIHGTLFMLIMIFPSVLLVLSDITKTIGEIIIAISIALIYPIISRTIGSQTNFERITESFLKMSSEEQAKTSKKGVLFFSLSMFYFPFIAFIIWLFD
ncbi:MAG: hypothetical protein AB8G11_08370 [Saprospiraceae bacterium]